MGPGGGCWGPGCYGTGGGGTWGVGVVWPLLWLLVVAGIVLGAVYLFTRRPTAAGPDRAMAVLREQYARGEISDEEFDERSSRLARESTARR